MSQEVIEPVPGDDNTMSPARNNTEEPKLPPQQVPNSKGVVDTSSEEDDTPDDATPANREDEKVFSFLTGMQGDLKARAPFYLDDWGRPKNLFTVINATIFAFVIQLIPALIFAELMDRETEGNLAIAETLLSSAVMGIIYAIFAGQPLVIMGITGPVSLLLGTSYGLTERFDANYFPFFFWICIWAAVMHMLSAMVGLVQLVWTVTPFTSQIFELFIAVTFIYTSVRDLVEPIYLGQGGNNQEDRAAQYATLVLGALTCWIAWSLHFADTWVYFTRQVRTFLSSYNTAIACVVVTAMSFLPGMDLDDTLDRVSIRFTPWDWQPTADRNWIVDPFDGIDGRGIMAAFIPGFMFFLLFIIDHNVSSILTQSDKYNLKKPPAYHWDFFVLGITFIPCAILGLPPGNGLIPQAPLHCRALCTRKHVVDEHGIKREVVTHCEEQRWSGLGQALLMFVALSCFTVLSWIPRGVLFGLFLYLGMGALHGNEIWERFLLCFVLPKKRPGIPVVKDVPWGTVVWWTVIQGICALTIFAIGQFASFGYIYPALLTALVPFRSYVLSRYFQEEHTKHLDPFGESEEEFHRDQKNYEKAMHEGDYDEEDVEFITHAMFRGRDPRSGKIRVRHSIGHAQDVLPDEIDPNHVIPDATKATHLSHMLSAHQQSRDLLSISTKPTRPNA